MRPSYFKLFLLSTSIILCSCAHSQNIETNRSKKSVPENVGDIQFDSHLDDKDFKICDPSFIGQYYNFGQAMMFEGEKSALVEHFQTRYKNSPNQTFSGFIVIRFVVNCEGKTGLFRVESLNPAVEKVEQNNAVADQLLAITKSLTGWGVPSQGERKFDYYQYLTFKIENGHLLDIMP